MKIEKIIDNPKSQTSFKIVINYGPTRVETKVDINPNGNLYFSMGFYKNNIEVPQLDDDEIKVISKKYTSEINGLFELKSNFDSFNLRAAINGMALLLMRRWNIQYLIWQCSVRTAIFESVMVLTKITNSGNTNIIFNDFGYKTNLLSFHIPHIYLAGRYKLFSLKNVLKSLNDCFYFLRFIILMSGVTISIINLHPWTHVDIEGVLRFVVLTGSSVALSILAPKLFINILRNKLLRALK